MEYTSYKNVKYYSECASLVEGMGYKLVELKIVPSKTITKISVIVSPTDPSCNMGINDCAKVHRALLPRLEALLGTEETTMELTSPGIEHNIKNACEFGVFIGWNVRVWDKTVTDWVSGKILSANEESVNLELEDGNKTSILYENIAKAKFVNNK